MINGREQARNRANLVASLTSSQTSQLQQTSSIHSLAPISPGEQNSLPSPITSNDDENQTDQEKQQLRNEILLLKNELQKSKDLINKLQKSEEQMRER